MGLYVAALVGCSLLRYSQYATTTRRGFSVGSALIVWGDKMPFPKNRDYAPQARHRLKPGERYCGNCERPVTGLLTTDANNRLVGECCAPSSFRSMYNKKSPNASAP
jgi:hypothetical protein